MTMCHSIELIGYQIQAHWQNNCAVLIQKDQSSKVFVGTALKIATGEILQISKIPDTLLFHNI